MNKFNFGGVYMKSLQKRQGDVLIINENSSLLRKETKQRLFGNQRPNKFKSNGKVVLAEGEVSGHDHAVLDEGQVEMFYSKDVQESIKHLRVKGEATVKHPEHAPLTIPEGNNAVLIQSEWSLQRARRVID